MNGFKSILAAPLVVKVLAALYVLMIYKDLQILREPTSASSQILLSFIPSIAFSVLLLVLLFRRIRWTWKVGIVHAGYIFASAAVMLARKNSLVEAAMLGMAKDAPLGTQINPEYIGVGILTAAVLMMVMSLVIAALWLKTRGYFSSPVSLETSTPG